MDSDYIPVMGHATSDCFCLHPRMKGIAMWLVHCGPFETMNKDKKKKGIRSLASNLWIVCDSSHDEAFNLEYSNVVAMLGSVQTCSGWPSWIWTIPTTGSCNLLSLAISIYNLFIVTVSSSVFLLVMKTTSDHINTCKEIFLVSQSSQAEVKTVR